MAADFGLARPSAGRARLAQEVSQRWSKEVSSEAGLPLEWR
jgi:hypothetical protein